MIAGIVCIAYELRSAALAVCSSEIFVSCPGLPCHVVFFYGGR